MTFDIAAILDALPEGCRVITSDEDWCEQLRDEGAQQERERLRQEVGTLPRYVIPTGEYVDVEDVYALLDDPDEADE